MMIPQRKAMRISLEKKGDAYAIFASMNGEPMHQLGYPIQLRFKEPSYVGIGVCSQISDKNDKVVLSNVSFENLQEN